MIPSGSMFSSAPQTARSSSSGALQSQTATTTHTSLNLSRPDLPRSQTPDGTLRLRGGPIHSRRVTWSEEVVDNEGLGRKKSKVCCIFKRNREFGESSDESSSDDSSDSSDDSDIGDEKRKGGEDGKKKCDKGHDHEHNHNHSHHGRRNPGRGNRRRPPSPNAYERMPRNSTKKDEDSTKLPGGEPKQLS